MPFGSARSAGSSTGDAERNARRNGRLLLHQEKATITKPVTQMPKRVNGKTSVDGDCADGTAIGAAEITNGSLRRCTTEGKAGGRS
jgi:hypothetical protein